MRGHSGYGTAGVVTGGVASVVIAVLNLSGCAAYVTSIVAYVRVGVLNASGVCTNVTGSIAVVIVLVFGCSCVGTVLVVTACVAIIVKNVFGAFGITSGKNKKGKYKNKDGQKSYLHIFLLI